MISEKTKEIWLEIIPVLVFCVLMAGFTALFLVITERRERRAKERDAKKG